MKIHRGTWIIYRDKNTDRDDELSHVVMGYIEKKMTLDYTMSRVEINNSCKKIIMENNDYSKNMF